MRAFIHLTVTFSPAPEKQKTVAVSDVLAYVLICAHVAELHQQTNEYYWYEGDVMHSRFIACAKSWPRFIPPYFRPLASETS